MKVFSKAILATLACLLTTAAIAQTNERQNQSTMISSYTSMFVVGDTTVVPLDMGSINSMFTPAFCQEVRQQTLRSLEKIGAEQGEDIKVGLPRPSVQLNYTSSGRAGKGGCVAQLSVVFMSAPNSLEEDVRNTIEVEASKAALKLLEDRIRHHFVRLAYREREQLEQQREVLIERRHKLDNELQQTQEELTQLTEKLGIEPSTAAVEDRYHKLKDKLLDNRIAEVDAVARREAIEKQVSALQAEAAAMGEPDAVFQNQLHNELKAAMNLRQQQLEKSKAEYGNDSQLIENLNVELATKKKELEAMGDSSRAELVRHRESINELASRIAEANAVRQRRLANAEVDATQARIAYLKAVEEQRQAIYGTRLEKLNAMLTDVSILVDESQARREAMAEELDIASKALRDQMDSADTQQRRRSIQLLKSELNDVEQTILEFTRKIETPPMRPRFDILPWGG